MVNRYHLGENRFCRPMIGLRLSMRRQRNCRAAPLTSFPKGHTPRIRTKLTYRIDQAEEPWCARNVGTRSPPSNGKQYSALFALAVVDPTGMSSCPDAQLMTRVIHNTRRLGFVTWYSRRHSLRTPWKCMMPCGTWSEPTKPHRRLGILYRPHLILT